MRTLRVLANRGSDESRSGDEAAQGEDDEVQETHRAPAPQRVAAPSTGTSNESSSRARAGVGMLASSRRMGAGPIAAEAAHAPGDHSVGWAAPLEARYTQFSPRPLPPTPGSVGSGLPDLPDGIRQVGFPLAVAMVLQQVPRMSMDIDAFLPANFHFYAQKARGVHAGGDGEAEARAVRAMVSAAGRPELIRAYSSPLLLLSALNLWAEVVDWLSQGTCREVARAHFRDCLDVLSLYPGDAGVAAAYDRCRRDAWSSDSGSVPLGSRDDAALRSAVLTAVTAAAPAPVASGFGASVESQSRKRFAVFQALPQSGAVAHSLPGVNRGAGGRRLAPAVSGPQASPPLCYAFNAPQGCSRPSCKFAHRCTQCLSNAHSAHFCPAGGSSGGGAPDTREPVRDRGEEGPERHNLAAAPRR